MSGSGKYPYYLNEQVSVEFYNLLLTHAAFKAEPKAVMAAFKWLNNVLRGQQRNDQKPVTFFSEDIKGQFGSYSSTPYTQFVDALVSLNLVTIPGAYQPGFTTKYLSQPGKCYTYSLTEQGKTLITSSNRQYFKKLNRDKLVRRKAQKRASENKSNHAPYGDFFFDYQLDLLMNLSFDFPKVDQILDQDDDCNDDCNFFHDIKDKHFNRLKRNATDGRVWNLVVAMGREYRPHLRYKGMNYVASIDQRACHPTFLGLFLLSFYKLKQAVSTLHYTAGNLDIQRESEEWTRFATSMDFRKKVGQEVGWPENMVKKRMNRWINGWKYEKLDEWLSKRFPALGTVWTGMDTPTRKKTGPQISLNFETKIFQDPELYRLADSLGLKLSYEYDGVGVFALSPNIDPELNKLDEHIKATARRIAGIDIETSIDRFPATKPDRVVRIESA
jgi:hypothetical protein